MNGRPVITVDRPETSCSRYGTRSRSKDSVQSKTTAPEINTTNRSENTQLNESLRKRARTRDSRKSSVATASSSCKLSVSKSLDEPRDHSNKQGSSKTVSVSNRKRRHQENPEDSSGPKQSAKIVKDKTEIHQYIPSEANVGTTLKGNNTDCDEKWKVNKEQYVAKKKIAVQKDAGKGSRSCKTKSETESSSRDPDGRTDFSIRSMKERDEQKLSSKCVEIMAANEGNSPPTEEIIIEITGRNNTLPLDAPSSNKPTSLNDCQSEGMEFKHVKLPGTQTEILVSSPSKQHRPEVLTIGQDKKKSNERYGVYNKVIKREDSQDPIFKGVSAILKAENFETAGPLMSKLRRFTGASVMRSPATGDVCLHGSWPIINKAYTFLQSLLSSEISGEIQKNSVSTVPNSTRSKVKEDGDASLISHEKHESPKSSVAEPGLNFHGQDCVVMETAAKPCDLGDVSVIATAVDDINDVEDDNGMVKARNGQGTEIIAIAKHTESELDPSEFRVVESPSVIDAEITTVKDESLNVVPDSHQRDKSVMVTLDSGGSVELVVEDGHIDLTSNEMEEETDCSRAVESNHLGIEYNENSSKETKSFEALHSLLVKDRRKSKGPTVLRKSSFIENIKDNQFHGEGQNSCDVCLEKFEHFTDLVAHKKDIHCNLTCHICSKTFTEKRYLAVHIKRHNGEKKYECPECGWRFFERSKMILHMEKHKPVKERKLPYQCNFCGHGFYNLSSWRDHRNTHLGIRPHQCDKCDASFAHRVGLQRHEKVHSKVLPFVCSVCGKAFKFKANLDSHSLQHTGNSKHKCHTCNKVYTVSTSLKRHHCKPLVITTQPETLYMCSVCSQLFDTMRSAERHVCFQTKPELSSAQQQDVHHQTQQIMSAGNASLLVQKGRGVCVSISNDKSTVTKNIHDGEIQLTGAAPLERNFEIQCKPLIDADDPHQASVCQDQHPEEIPGAIQNQIILHENIVEVGSQPEFQLDPNTIQKSESSSYIQSCNNVVEVCSLQGEHAQDMRMKDAQPESIKDNSQCISSDQVQVIDSESVDKHAYACGWVESSTEVNEDASIHSQNQVATIETVLYVDEKQVAANTLAHLSATV